MLNTFIAYFTVAFGALLLGWLLAYHRANAILWSGAMLFVTALAYMLTGIPGWLLAGAAGLALVFGVVGGIKPLRRALVTRPIFRLYKRILPQMSDTEREALEAGTVWWDKDLFTGRPDWAKLIAVPRAELTAEERAFVDGPVEELCAMLDDWEVTHERMDLPPAAWEFIKSQGFLGIIIPKQYGGLGFSNLAHSEIVTKIATRSGAAAVTVMVPNSLGPGELLLHYGTEAQKNHYLPRLARGEEIPCFGLTSPEAGSDAGSIPDLGIVCKGMHEGREVLGIRLTFDKRYITLAPVATLVGLAFKLHDPDKLLSDDTDRGITLALVPRDHPGMDIGRRHFPLNAAFMNGPIRGQNVFIPIDWVIGGAPMVGRGWRMLMECLAAGRAISLPGTSMAAGWAYTRATGAYCRIRSQFKTPIGRFEGIEEPLARIGATTYMMDATRRLTMTALDLGEKPSVISAINKYHMTEAMRVIVSDAMDIHGGKGICLGPNNYLGRAYQALPIAITVEGANILTRSLIIFGQGAIRCHPYVLREMRAAQANDLKAFDEALFEHFAFTIANAARALFLGLTGGKGVTVGGAPEMRRYLQMLTRGSSAFGLLADISMFYIGGSLKRKERLSARLGDILSLLYLSSAVVKRYHDDGCPREDLPLVRYALFDAMFKMQVAADGIIKNFPSRAIAWMLRRLIFPKGMTLVAPSDALSHEVCKLLLSPNASRDRLTAGMYLPRDEKDVLGKLEFALEATLAAEPIEAKLRAAVKDGRLGDFMRVTDLWEAAKAGGVITEVEHAQLLRTQRLKRSVIDVDDFPFDLSRRAESHSPTLAETRRLVANA
jgi:acyl-CoA dehydrogenase